MRTTEQRGPMTQLPRRSSFQATRVVAWALAAGVGLLWGVAWVLTDGGVLGISPDSVSTDAALVTWAALALPGFAGALYFRNRASARGGRRAPSPGRPTRRDRQRAQTSAIIAHALLEGPALLGGVFFLLIGVSPVVQIALPVYFLGLILTWPQREWFGEG
jgi:hypothetical protein